MKFSCVRLKRFFEEATVLLYGHSPKRCNEDAGWIKTTPITEIVSPQWH